MKRIFEVLEEKLGKGRVKTTEPLSLHTTFRLGGPAQFYFEANTVNELEETVKLAKELNIAYLILGGGSNILVGDKGFPGLVVRNKTKEIKILKYTGKVQSSKSKVQSVLVGADSGVPFNQLVRFTIEEGLAGLEEFLGLPGTVGGAVMGNSHWQSKTVGDFIVSQKTLDGEILLSVVFKLTKEDKDILWQKAREAVEYRKVTQPLGFPSAGCIFKNIKKSEAARIGTPGFTTSAGFLIEAVGLKGARIAKVQISPVHANFIINLGGGKAADVLKLISLAKECVKEKFGVKLEEEIVKVGEF